MTKLNFSLLEGVVFMAIAFLLRLPSWLIVALGVAVAGWMFAELTQAVTK